MKLSREQQNIMRKAEGRIGHYAFKEGNSRSAIGAMITSEGGESDIAFISDEQYFYKGEGPNNDNIGGMSIDDIPSRNREAALVVDHHADWETIKYGNEVYTSLANEFGVPIFVLNDNRWSKNRLLVYTPNNNQPEKFKDKLW